MTILIIEDNEYKANTMIKALASLGMNNTIVEKTSYISGLKELEKYHNDYDLIILDNNLPRYPNDFNDIVRNCVDLFLQTIYLKDLALNQKIIIYSSDDLIIDKEYQDYIVGKRVYSASKDIAEELK